MDAQTTPECIIWGSPATYLGGHANRDGSAFDSPRAGGRYFVTRSAAISVSRLPDVLKIKLTHEIVSANMRGDTLEINTYFLETLGDKPLSTAIERADRLLAYLIKQSVHIGKKLSFPMDLRLSDDLGITIMGLKWGSRTAPLFAYSDSLETEEVDFLLDILRGDGAISTDRPNSLEGLMVLPWGYSRADAAKSLVRTKQAFVAMWFDSSMDLAYAEGFGPAITSAGFDPVRIDQKEHINKIDDEIIAEIRRSRFLVADFTSERDKPRGGVYFEAGFALGLSIPVIWTCRSDQIENVHFDTRQFNHIVWSSTDELNSKLTNRIGAVIV